MDPHRRDGVVAAPRPLTKHDLDRRIESLLADVASAGRNPDPGSDTEGQPLRPRLVSPAVLVALVHPFLSNN